LSGLEPLAGTCGVNGAVVAFAGSHAHTAGLLATALGRDGSTLLRLARDTYERLAAKGWLAEIEQEPSSGQAEGTTRVLRRQGRTWEVVFAGQHTTVPHSKGLADLSVLLAAPGRDVHVLDLYGSADRSGPAGELADRQALASYRQRLADLDDETDEAARHNDIERQARLEHEREALLDELTHVTRPGNRARSFPNYPAERARKAVAARIRDTIRKLEQDLPNLASFLDQTIVTGTYCRYRADAGPTWQIDQ
jgi:hypothetical protein